MRVDFINPPELCPTFGWTHVAAVQGGKTIYISGQVSVNERGELIGRGDLRAQTRYVVGLKPEHVPIIREVRSQYVRADHPPVSTLVGISALVGPEWLIEIEAVAVVAE
jgi:enamine deaminase RidA (YjgF/YER057c/UK114 family)